MSLFRPSATFPVAPGVEGFRSVLVNYYFVHDPGGSGWVLVDAGMIGGAARLLRAAKRRFGDQPPRAIVLTHGHFDHVGALSSLLSRWRVPVYAHARELPFLNAHEAYPPPDPSVGGGLVARSSPLFPRRVGPFPVRVQALPVAGELPAMRGWRWVETPGHSPGHVSFWRESDKVLLAGDALVSTRQESLWSVWQQTPEVRPPPAYFTPNWRLAYDSLERLRALQPEVLASGHGQPMKGDALRSGLDRLTREFEARGLPRHGRYVQATWSPSGLPPPRAEDRRARAASAVGR